jgi:hypothetical protein
MAAYCAWMVSGISLIDPLRLLLLALEGWTMIRR